MGKPNSKPKESGTDQHNTLQDHPVTIVQESSGFHMFELHLPSMGFSFFAVFIILLVMYVAFKVYRHYLKSRDARRQTRRPLQPVWGNDGTVSFRPGPPALPQLTPAMLQNMQALFSSPHGIPGRRYADEPTGNRFSEVDDDVPPSPLNTPRRTPSTAAARTIPHLHQHRPSTLIEDC